MSAVAIAAVPTASGAKYAQQLTKHWSHNLITEYADGVGKVTFPAHGRSGDWAGDAVLTLTAHDDHLDCRIDASEAGQLEVLKGVVSSHLDRFAFREAPLPFNWQSA